MPRPGNPRPLLLTMSAMGGKRTLADAKNLPSAGLIGLRFSAAIARATNDRDASRNLDLPLLPIASVLLQEGIATVAPGIPKIVRALGGTRDKADRLPQWGRSNVVAHEGDGLNAVFGAVAGILIHAGMMGNCSTVRNGSIAAGPLGVEGGPSVQPLA